MSSSAPAPTPAQEQCLKIVWGLVDAGSPVTTTTVSERLGQSKSTVSDMVRRLVDDGYLSHEPYGDIALTPVGARAALRIVRRHRLLETFLTATLGYRWDEVHQEADALEHVVSDTMIARIDHSLGHPSTDPHGDPIPTETGEVPESSTLALPDLAPETPAIVARVDDTNPEFLRFLATHRIAIGSPVLRRPTAPYSTDVMIQVTDPDSPSEVSIAADLARTIRVAPGK